VTGEKWGAKKDVEEEGTMGHLTRILVLAFALTAVTFGIAFAEIPYTDMFNAEYGTSGGYNYNPQLGSCLTCHPSGSSRNAFANDWRNNGHNFANVESMDSDNDGFTNLDEIVAGTFPGDSSSKPAITNNPPIADAGPTQTVDEGVRVTLNGSNSSDPDDGIASYLWEQTGGTSVNLSNTNAVRPTFNSPNVGTSGESLTFQLTVTDNGNLQSSDSVIVNVTWINEPPTANSGSDQTVNEGVTVTLDASNSMDLDDGIASYQWTQLGNTTRVTLSSNTAEQPTFTAPNVGLTGESLTFQLTVTDNGNLKTTDTCIVNVTWINEPPFADSGPDQFVNPGDTVTLDGSNSSDVDDGIASYLWKQTGGTSVNLSSTTAAQPTFTAPNLGASGDTLTFQLTVTDNGNLKSTDISVVDVAPVEPDPTPDTTPPVISNVQVTSITDTTAMIEWTTDEPGDSLVAYGTLSTQWGSYPDSKNNTGMALNHSVTLTGLLQDTTYYFRVGSTDASGNGPTTSGESIFMTVPVAETPPTIARSIPRHGSGIVNGKRVPTDTSFAVRIKDDDGIDVTDTSSVRFTINDGVNPEYARDLNDGTVVRVVKLTSGTDTQTTDFWIVYDRSNDDEYENGYAFDTVINIKVDAKDKQQTSMAQASYDFKIESQEQKNNGKGKRPNQNKTTEAGTTTLTVASSDDLDGFELEYESDEPITPYVEDSHEIPSLDLQSVTPVGVPVNLGPPNVFNNPVTLTLPVPDGSDPGELHLYLYDGVEWTHASGSYNTGGEVLPGGDGWMIPGSLVYHDDTEPPTLEFQVNHFSAVQAAFVDSAIDSVSDSSSAGTAGCFISAATIVSPVQEYLPIVILAVAVLIGLVRLGRKFSKM
jgi:hypothetical protein